jgi:hypothetical protein
MNEGRFKVGGGGGMGKVKSNVRWKPQNFRKSSFRELFLIYSTVQFLESILTQYAVQYNIYTQ